MSTPAEILKRHGIGLTGGIGTGKSTVARLLAAQGVPVIDADHLARDVTRPGSPALVEITEAFGTAMLTKAGVLERKKLGQLVFADPAARTRLEAITHPRIREALARELEKRGLTANPQLFVYEAALIFENCLEAQFRTVWVTTCSAAEQIRRVMQRDGVGEERVRQILAAQLPMPEKLARAGLVIDSDQSLATLEALLIQSLADERHRL